MPEPALTSLPPEVVALIDHERLAQARLPQAAWAYFQGGAADEVTVSANRAAWDAMRLRPRVLRNLTGGHTRIKLLGRTCAHPILLAPVAFQRMAHPDAELATAVAASAQEAGMVLSCQSSTLLEHVARAIGTDAGRGPLWFQLYLQHDRDFTLELVRRAEAAGYEALVLTVDAPTSGARDRERRAGFSLPPGIEAVNLLGLPPWRPAALQPGQSAMFDGLLQQAPTWGDVAWLKAHTRLPVLLKGILHPDDARAAHDAGADGLIVSNHGGRTLDTALPTAEALPAIVAAVGHTMPVLVDGGIRRGTDVLKALALGARAVLVGRPQVHGLATAGAMGVAHVLRLLRDELEIAMALCGVATLDQIDADLVMSR
ncbi:alpha-hydroxy-acid oxidizing enzyme [Aquabacterium olei]|uniref:Alpha-hydroxy-acid oxidizing enzyme n=1 Tax=Aquabacterium olei TaxID=1296669 RepID=A0A2U8FMQ8_9BURK|nr:alpha-hydroxy acid oxidase [Aquabacterium olei]AWI52331.1 alpha-hydroxy-acid oxidizing enzyme [Aquabacterium olei]